MNIVEINQKTIYGISVRTCNADEMNPQTARIGKTWEQFDKTVAVDYAGGERVYGVYYHYASDAKGDFDVMAGYEKENSALESIIIQSGNYLVFGAKAKTADDDARVQAVMEAWKNVWEYFANEQSEYKRAYKTDFEYYKNQTEIDVCISVL